MKTQVSVLAITALGAAAISAGLGYAAVPLVGAALAACGLVLVWLGTAAADRTAASGG